MKQAHLRVLGIESSCDETAAAIVEGGRVIHSNVVASQIDLHAQYGGVYPELASREHVRAIYPTVEAALKNAYMNLSEIDAIAVTQGPGLAGSLVIGVNAAKAMALASGKPLIPVNHLEAHIYAAWLHKAGSKPGPEPKFPLIALLVSGGHTELVLMSDHLQYQSLGSTLDDAAGEAFDKVARLLNLSYPGGPAIQAAALDGNPEAYKFPIARLDSPWDFSFSGLKTAVMRQVDAYKDFATDVPVADIAASFQATVVETLFSKTMAAAETHKAREIIVAGGVSANRALRDAFRGQNKFKVHIPHVSLCTDNAAMIAAAGFRHLVNGESYGLDFDVLPNWPLSTSA
ncbi:MAG TPA: tRNA (adenosine(37)-N6)-threonylcarbamoyltransferase complex transferase subunit TsaD [Anaerolineaceae bacterium]|jgi:N6-L-threonylcarbamoyladenine synthase|nr:tRNA (adenosine(37)-N6)-threonylcarbamoyltransferase complex transferase subunit TsaD [Anaerolineaceae bacterium]HOH92236.1 tRNA (adenosine(37)-N6)-threonylcarbamoyltransferase complex transferase subunit TsaD [Anaerolineaceae bacterium]HQN68650.1 tRNA (adenosine(37)-N6)-threonylcarbamoyltransferase complex transferase subunit TsaD [Anaerolineaceae bacterium]